MLSCVLLCVCESAQASSLFGKVIDVSSGDVITIVNLNRPVRVKLLGVDAPEINQAFGDVAKKHLADLVHDRSVLVEYSGLAGDGSVTGKVLLDDFDIGAQMIRDGVAWFDPNNVNRLSATDREIYQYSEQVARSERRGLWQADNPTAPWEFAKAAARKKNFYPSLTQTVTTSRPRSNKPVSELTNLTLLIPDTYTPRSSSRSDLASPDEIRAAWASLTSSPKHWHELRPEGQNFSAMVPDEGKQLTFPMQLGTEQVDVHMHVARDSASVYAVFWVNGPALGETDKAALEGTVVDSFIKGFHDSYARGDRGEFTCPRKIRKDISTMGYMGIEFDFSSCTLPTRGRAFTKVTGDQRQLFFGVVFYGDEDETVWRFMKSFNVSSSQKSKPRRR